MSIRILLVFPKLNFSTKKDFALPPLGILSLGCHLKAQLADIEVHLLDLETKKWDRDTCVSCILGYQPDLVCFSVMTPYLDSTMSLISGIKKKDNSVKVALGGPHITGTGSEIFSLDYFHMPDFLVYGEGEETLVDIVKNLDNDTAEIKGAVRRLPDGSLVGQSKIRGFIQNLDSLPIIDFGLLNISEYSIVQSKTKNSLSLMASRGCPFNCSFCDVSITQGKKLRLRSPWHIVKEIKQAKDKYNITDFYFKDSTFTLNREWVIELCNLLINENIKITWKCNSRAELVDDELLSLMRKSGCDLIAFGFESVDNEVLAAMSKKLTAKNYSEAIKSCKKNDILVYGFFMVGNFEENLERAQKTLDFALQEDIAWAAFSPVVAYPGTELYRKAIKEGVLKDPKWYLTKGGKSFVSLVIGKGGLEHPDFPVSEQIQFMKRANREFYLRPKWILKILPQFLSIDYIKKIGFFFLRFIRFIFSSFKI